MTTTSELQTKEAARVKLSEDVAAFVAAGGVVERPIYQPFKVSDVSPAAPAVRKETTAERYARWARLRAQGMSYKRIAAAEGVSGNAVFQALKSRAA